MNPENTDILHEIQTNLKVRSKTTYSKSIHLVSGTRRLLIDVPIISHTENTHCNHFV